MKKNNTTHKKEGRNRILQVNLKPVAPQKSSKTKQKNQQTFSVSPGEGAAKPLKASPVKGYTKRLQLQNNPSPIKQAEQEIPGYSRLALPDVRSLNRRRQPRRKTEHTDETASFSEIKVAPKSATKQEWIEPTPPRDVEVPCPAKKFAATPKTVRKRINDSSDSEEEAVKEKIKTAFPLVRKLDESVVDKPGAISEAFKNKAQVKLEKVKTLLTDPNSDCEFVTERAPKIKPKSRANTPKAVTETTLPSESAGPPCDDANSAGDKSFMTPGKENKKVTLENAKTNQKRSNDAPTPATTLNSSHEDSPPFKKKLLFDKGKLSLALMKLKTSSSDSSSKERHLSRSDRADSVDSFSSTNTDIACLDLIPPETPRPLDFELEGSSKAKKKKKDKKKHKRRHRTSGDSSSDVVPTKKSRTEDITPGSSRSTSVTRSPQRNESGSSSKKRSPRPHGDGDEDIVLVAELNNEAPPSSSGDAAQAMTTTNLAEAKGLKRTARKTLKREKNTAKEMEMVAQFKISQQQPGTPATDPKSAATPALTSPCTTVRITTSETVTKPKPVALSAEMVKKNSALVLNQLIRKKPKVNNSATLITSKSTNLEKTSSPTPSLSSKQSNASTDNISHGWSTNTPVTQSKLSPSMNSDSEQLPDDDKDNGKTGRHRFSSSETLAITSPNMASVAATYPPNTTHDVSGNEMVSPSHSNSSAATTVASMTVVKTSDHYNVFPNDKSIHSPVTSVTSKPPDVMQQSNSSTEMNGNVGTQPSATPSPIAGKEQSGSDAQGDKDGVVSQKPEAVNTPPRDGLPKALAEEITNVTETASSPVTFKPAEVKKTYGKQSLSRTKSAPEVNSSDSTVKDKWAKSVETYSTKQKTGDTLRKPSPVPTDLGDLNAKVDGDKNTPKAAPVISQGEQSQSSSESQLSQSQPSLVIDTQPSEQSQLQAAQESSPPKKSVHKSDSVDLDEPLFSPYNVPPPSVQVVGHFIEAPPSVAPPTPAPADEEPTAEESDADGCLSITNVRTVDVPIIDENFTPSEIDKHLGQYRFPNGARVVTMYKDGQLYCASHELVIKLRISMSGLTQIKCTAEEGARIRTMGRSHLKENFEFKLVPLAEVNKVLETQHKTLPLTTSKTSPHAVLDRRGSLPAYANKSSSSAETSKPKLTPSQSNPIMGDLLKQAVDTSIRNPLPPDASPGQSQVGSMDMPSVGEMIGITCSTDVHTDVLGVPGNISVMDTAGTTIPTHNAGKSPGATASSTHSCNSASIPTIFDRKEGPESNDKAQNFPANKNDLPSELSFASNSQTHINALPTTPPKPVTTLVIASPETAAQKESLSHMTNSMGNNVITIFSPAILTAQMTAAQAPAKALSATTAPVSTSASTVITSTASKTSSDKDDAVTTWWPQGTQSTEKEQTPSANDDVIFVEERKSPRKTNASASDPGNNQSATSVSTKRSASSSATAISPSSLLMCVDAFTHMAGDYKGVRKALGQNGNLTIAVAHTKVLTVRNKVYKGQLSVNYGEYNTKTPFIVSCSMGCGANYSPLDFMLHLEREDKGNFQTASSLWVESIILDPEIRLSGENQVVFWNTFVDWFQLFVEMYRACGGAKVTDRQSSNTAVSGASNLHSMTSAKHTSATRSAVENLSYLDKIPASPAPYQSQKSAVPTSNQRSTAGTQATTSMSSSSMAPPPVLHTQNQGIDMTVAAVASGAQRAPPHRAMYAPSMQAQPTQQQHQTIQSLLQRQGVYQQQNSLQQYGTSSQQTNSMHGMLGHYKMKHTKQTTHPSSTNQGSAIGTLEMVRSKILPKPSTLTPLALKESLPAATTAISSRSDKHDTYAPGYRHAVSQHQTQGTSAAAATAAAAGLYYNNRALAANPRPTSRSSGTMSPGMSASPPTSGHNTSEVVNQAIIQKTNAVIGIEASFKMMEEEINSLRTQLTAERREKQDYAIKLSKSIAESQAQAQQIEAYRLQLSQYQSIWPTQVTMNRR